MDNVAYQFENNLYMCQVMESSVHSELDINVLGVNLPYSKSEDRIKKYEDTPITVYLTISRMVEIFLDNRPIQVTDSNDAISIHDIAREYISLRLKHRTVYNGPEVDLNKLRDIENFADTCLNLNRPKIMTPMLDNKGLRGHIHQGRRNTQIPVTEEEWAEVKVYKPEIK